MIASLVHPEHAPNSKGMLQPSSGQGVNQALEDVVDQFRGNSSRRRLEQP